jgi:hypothetical protein
MDADSGFIRARRRKRAQVAVAMVMTTTSDSHVRCAWQAHAVNDELFVAPRFLFDFAFCL